MRGMDKEDVLFKYNGILVIIKTETMPLAATWMELEITILSWLGKDRHCMSLYDTYMCH